MSNMGFGVGIDANLLVKTVQEKICRVRKERDENKYQYVSQKYYRPYVRRINIWNWIRKLIGLKPLHIIDSNTYCSEFSSKGLSVSEMIEYMFVGAEYTIELDELEKIAALVDAGVRNNTKVYLNPNQCQVLGFGNRLIPLTAQQQEHIKAEEELNTSLSNSIVL